MVVWTGLVSLPAPVATNSGGVVLAGRVGVGHPGCLCEVGEGVDVAPFEGVGDPGVEVG